MDGTGKYLIHADLVANGVVERNDVVGAIFGQTEGLLGDELDLRSLQEDSKVGRIDVDVESEGGQSFGTLTIASGLDRVETAILAAALETIEQVGPCRATLEVTDLEDVRTAKRREVVDRATDLLATFDAESVSTRDIVEEVRQRVRVADVTEYEGYPAGPRVTESDAIVVVEGRADVLNLLRYGVKNTVAVEGTDVPEAVADLTHDRTVTAFLDGDRGGELVLKELGQVGEVDYVTFAPAGSSVEDLSRREALDALRDKVPFEAVADVTEPGSVLAAAGADGAGADPEGGSSTLPAETDDAARTATDGSANDGRSLAAPGDSDESEEPPVGAAASSSSGGSTAAAPAATDQANGATETESAPATAGDDVATSESTASDPAPAEATPAGTDAAGSASDAGASGDARSDREVADDESAADADDEEPATLAGHVQAVIGDGSGRVRFLSDDAEEIAEAPAEAAFDRLEAAETVPATVVVDAVLEQRLLDVAAQRGVETVVAAGEGEFVKRPTSVRVRTVDDF